MLIGVVVAMLLCTNSCAMDICHDKVLQNISRGTDSLVDSKSWFNRLHAFSLFKQKERENILLRSLLNDTRLATDSLEVRTFLIESVLVQPSSQFREMLCLSQDKKLTEENFLSDLVDMWGAFCQIPGTKLIERSFALNVSLFNSGLCPLIMFSFDNWKNIDNERDLIDLIELSTSFLYRLVDYSSSDKNELGKFLGKGGYSNVFLSKDGKVVSKIPRNFAQFLFGADEEFAVSKLLEVSPVAQYVPRLLGYDSENRIISREFIDDGVDGVTMLKEQKQILEIPMMRNQLNEFYMYACYLWSKFGINLDIHPGNFLWSTKRGRWFFVDIGPMPKIGAEYFPRNGFDSYFKKVWCDLHRLMVDVPIRSVDVAVDFVEIAPLRGKLSDFLCEFVKDQ